MMYVALPAVSSVVAVGVLCVGTLGTVGVVLGTVSGGGLGFFSLLENAPVAARTTPTITSSATTATTMIRTRRRPPPRPPGGGAPGPGPATRGGGAPGTGPAARPGAGGAGGAGGAAGAPPVSGAPALAAAPAAAAPAAAAPGAAPARVGAEVGDWPIRVAPASATPPPTFSVDWPTLTTSPGASQAEPSIFLPLTNVPLVEPRSEM